MIRSDHQTGFKITESDYETLAMLDVNNWLADEEVDAEPSEDGGPEE